MKDNRTAMVMASFLGDSLALGVHWIYDTARIQTEFGRVDSLLKPKPDSYHPTKEKGEFTHYGDQTLVLLESVAARNGFRLDDFAVRWGALFNRYRGYYDQATKSTLRNFELGRNPEDGGSSSHDLAGAARIAPLVFRYPDDPDSLAEAARAADPDDPQQPGDRGQCGVLCADRTEGAERANPRLRHVPGCGGEVRGFASSGSGFRKGSGKKTRRASPPSAGSAKAVMRRRPFQGWCI